MTCKVKWSPELLHTSNQYLFLLSFAFTFSLLLISLIISATLLLLAYTWSSDNPFLPFDIRIDKKECEVGCSILVSSVFLFIFSMQIDPQDFEKLLKKQKSDPNAFPMVSQVPHRKSLQFVVNPPMKLFIVFYFIGREIQQNAFPVNVGEINQSCFMKLITSGIICRY